MKPDKDKEGRGRGRGRGRGKAGGRGNPARGSGSSRKRKALETENAEAYDQSWYDDIWPNGWGHPDEEWGQDGWGSSGYQWDKYAWQCGKEALTEIGTNSSSHEKKKKPKGDEKGEEEGKERGQKKKKRQEQEEEDMNPPKVGKDSSKKTSKAAPPTKKTKQQPSASSKKSKPKQKEEEEEEEKEDEEEDEKSKKKDKKKVRAKPGDVRTIKHGGEEDIMNIRNFVAHWKDDPTEQADQESKDYMKGLLKKLKKCTECRLNAYWKVPSCGVTSKSQGKDIAHFNFSMYSELTYMSMLAACMKCAEKFVSWINIVVVGCFIRG